MPTLPPTLATSSSVGSHRHEDPDDSAALGWVLRLWVVVLALVAVTAVRSWQVGIPPRDPGGEFLRTRVLITVGVALALAIGDAVRRTPHGWRSPRAVSSTLRARWTRRRTGVVVAGLAAYHLTYFCYHQLKSWNAFRGVQDDALARLDRRVLGTSPARWLHDVLGTGIADRVLVTVYESFPTLVAVAFVAPLVLSTRVRRGFVAIAAFVWVWVLGVTCYYLVPSLGPFHHSPADFAALPDDVVRHTQAAYLAQRAHLLAHPQAHDAVAQIGAFASLHVGVTCVIVLVSRSFGLRRTTRVLGVYLAATCVATVYLGWHFVSDDLAGLVIAVLAVTLGRWTVGDPDRVPMRTTSR